MSQTHWIELKLVNFVEALEIVSILINHGWSLTDKGMTTFLPVEDQNNFQWETREMSLSELKELFEKKIKLGETIGLEINWKDSQIGGELLIKENNQILFSISKNRRTISYSPEFSFVDLNWYFLVFVSPFIQERIKIEAVKYEGIF